MKRKPRLLRDTPTGAQLSARLYSRIEIARANSLEPLRYLRHVFTELPKAVTAADIEALLPWNVALPEARLVEGEQCPSVAA